MVGKVHNGCTILRRFSRRQGREEVEPCLQTMEQVLQKIAGVADLDTLRGLEGTAARAYFAAVRRLLPEGVVLTLWREGILKEADFEKSGEGLPCQMVSAGRKKLIGALEDKLESQMIHPRLDRLLDLRRILQSQVRHYRAVLMGAAGGYHPFKLR